MTISRLFLDIETSPNVGYFWRPGYKISLTSANILKERAIICVSYKWEHETTVKTLTWDRRQDDRVLCKKIAKIIESADEVVAHNGGRFDIAWIRGRCLKHGVPFPPTITIQDTLTLSRRYFNLNEHRLDYIAKHLGIGKKIKTEFDLWKDVMRGDQAALDDMVEYCEMDVRLLEKVFRRMMPYVPAKSHFSGKRGECPECGSGNMKISRHRMTAAGHKRVQLVCGECGKYHTIAGG